MGTLIAHYRIIMRSLKECLMVLYIVDKSFKIFWISLQVLLMEDFLNQTDHFKNLQKKTSQKEPVKNYYGGKTRAVTLRNLSDLLSIDDFYLMLLGATM